MACNIEQNDEDLITTNPSHPLLIHTILKCLFGHLHVSDIKIFRHVCLTWNYVAETLLRRRSVITFRQQSPNFSEFTETFDESQSKLPFTCFRFIDVKSPISEFEEFLSNQGQNIRELFLIRIALEEEVRDYDISHWISPSYSTSISTLRINLNDSSPLTVSLYELKTVQTLELISCKIKVKNGIRISPLNISLISVKFYQDENLVREICINDYIEVKTAKVISLSCSRASSTIILNLNEAGIENIDKLTLNEVTLANWAISRCNVNSLRISEVPFLQKTDVKIKELYFKSSSIDLAALPQEIEKLSIECGFIRSNITCSRPILLYHLKELHLSSGNGFLVLHHFQDCPNLVDIKLCRTYGYEEINATINLDWIPKSVKTMKMQGIKTIVGDSTLDVENLIFDGYSLLDAQNVLEKVKPKKKLVVNRMNIYETDDDALRFLNEDTVKSLEKVYIEPFRWPPLFASSRLSGYVAKIAEYFRNSDGNSH